VPRSPSRGGGWWEGGPPGSKCDRGPGDPGAVSRGEGLEDVLAKTSKPRLGVQRIQANGKSKSPGRVFTITQY